MFGVRLLSLSMIALSLTGCLSDRENRFTRFRSSTANGSPDTVYLQYVIVERPLGDPSIDREPWNDVDEMVIPVDCRPMTSSNGFRIGLTGGIVPPHLQELIANPKHPLGLRDRRMVLHQGKAIQLNGPSSTSEFQIHYPNEDRTTSEKFEQMTCSLHITPSVTESGKIKLEFMPEIQHYDKKHWLPPGAVGAGWLRDKPTEKYPALGWEVSLAPTEYLLIGTWYEKADTLGSEFFTSESGKQPVQRMLILRAGRTIGSNPAADFFNDDSSKKTSNRVPPLAQQASTGTVRGTRP